MEGKVFCFIMVTSLGAELDLTTDWSFQTQESIKIRENKTVDDTYWYDPMVEIERRLADTPTGEAMINTDIDHIPDVAGFKKHRLPVMSGQGMDMAVLEDTNPEQKSAHKAWGQYQHLSEEVASEVGKVQGSLQSIESKLRNGDDTGDQFMLQLKMAKLVMMLLNKVVEEEKPEVIENGEKVIDSSNVDVDEEDGEEKEHHVHVNNVPAVLPAGVVLDHERHPEKLHQDKRKSVQWWNMMGWMILLSIVAGGILIGCACSISQCIPVDVKKLKRSMKPRYSEISWVSDSKCDTSKSVNSFCSWSKSREAPRPIGRNTAVKLPLACGQSGNSYSINPAYGAAHRCYTGRLTNVYANLDELKYGDLSPCHIDIGTQPKQYNRKWCTHSHNKSMSMGHTHYIDDCCMELDDDLGGVDCLRYLPHKGETFALHKTEKCTTEDLESGLVKLPHED